MQWCFHIWPFWQKKPFTSDLLSHVLITIFIVFLLWSTIVYSVYMCVCVCSALTIQYKYILYILSWNGFESAIKWAQCTNKYTARHQSVSRPGMDKPAERLTREKNSEFESRKAPFLLLQYHTFIRVRDGKTTIFFSPARPVDPFPGPARNTIFNFRPVCARLGLRQNL